ncbi:hypothetical protein B879_04253 [Cecembia lonarensis LW9]|uniref:Uncharacterized protein n=1 Tax=Cecembia lonarensis (strain CCUG 58316 / KCTC 22772 / LW9) TaxID=1225176 RepID=K1LSS0_CECL9|nr:hypothetical protein B879_04253 [Cecembia lonarensis LW9]
MPAADVMAHQGLGEYQIAVGVESTRQFVGLVIQVAFHLVPATFPSVAGYRPFLTLCCTAETDIQLGRRAVGDVGQTPGNAQPCRGHPIIGVVVAAGEVRIQADRRGLDLGEGNLFGRGFGSGRYDHAMSDPFGELDGPLQRTSPTQGAAKHRMPGLDA